VIALPSLPITRLSTLLEATPLCAADRSTICTQYGRLLGAGVTSGTQPSHVELSPNGRFVLIRFADAEVGIGIPVLPREALS
jgi:hypothetical protein